MRHLYADVDGWSTINLCDLTFAFDKPTWVVQGVEVLPKNRGQGIARNLMKLVLEEADEEGVTLLLAVCAPYGHGRPSDSKAGLYYEDLRAWYARLGFEPWLTDETGRGMIRHPRLAVNT